MSTAMRLSILAICAAGATVSAADWPSWRGPSGSSSTSESALPVTWSATQNVAWKAPSPASACRRQSSAAAA